MNKIGGLEKFSLVDYDGKISSVIFMNGCNFRCPFCHNSSLVLDDKQSFYTEEEILSFLKTRIGYIEAVVISGGEPTLYKNLETFIIKIRELGFLIKLDTNGTNPSLLKHLIETNLIDYCAMDIKNSLNKYALTAGLTEINIDNIKESISILKESDMPFEFRTTIVNELHTIEDIKEIGEIIKGPYKYFLQKFEDSPSCIKRGYTSVDKIKALEYKSLLLDYNLCVTLRGY